MLAVANRLKVAKVLSIKQLHDQGWSQRRIARELGISRDAVARHLAKASDSGEPPTEEGDSNKATSEKAPTGSHQQDCSPNKATTPTKAPTGSRTLSPTDLTNQTADQLAESRSCCQPFRQKILDKLEQGLSAQRIYQDLIDEHGFDAKYHSVRRFVAKLNQVQPLPFRRIEVAAAEEAQVDFGSGAPIIGEDGKRRRTHVLRVVLSHSRKGYSESVFRQTTENFIRCIENAFRHFGGVPKTLVPDNLKAAVLKADWYDPELNPKLRSFCEHYGTVLLPTKPRTPRHKGKVERGVDYVQENALKGRTFRSLGEQNDHLLHWESTVADTRIHGTTRKQVCLLFEEERSALGSLPLDHFPCFQEAQRKVSRDGHVAVAKAYYSLPPEYLGHTLWVRWDSRVVRVFNDSMELICTHATQPPGKFSTLREHLASEKIHPIERGTDWLLKKCSCIGENTKNWSLGLVANRGIEAVRVLHGLLNLIDKHPSSVIEQACEVAHANDCYQLRSLRKLIEHHSSKQKSFDFLEEHPLIRNLSAYGDLVRVDFQKETDLRKETICQ
jgi:transposase